MRSHEIGLWLSEGGKAKPPPRHPPVKIPPVKIHPVKIPHVKIPHFLELKNKLDKPKALTAETKFQ